MRLPKAISYSLLGIGIFILCALVFQYVINPKYSFPQPHAFNGDSLYNPYQGIDSAKWRRANFHVHSRAYMGVTNGGANSNEFIDEFYSDFGYSIIGISDYQKINTYESKEKWFFPVYEHGWQYPKTHHLVLNAKKVSWLDYFFRQTLSNKQSIIDHLKKDTSVIITINHPGLRNAFRHNDLKYLSNYNCLEISNNRHLFTSYFDTVLSAGHPVFLMANDDAHNLTKIYEGAYSYNLINTDLLKDSVLHSIKTGRAVGVNFKKNSYKTNEEKKSAMLMLPDITFISLKNDTLSVGLNKLVKSVKFIGQQGSERKIVKNCNTASYFFNKDDTYIRTEIECMDGTIFFLNPVFRYDGVKLTDYFPVYNPLKTWLWRAVVVIALIITLLTYKKKYLKK